MRFAYTAVDPGGKTVNDTLEAPDLTEAMDALRRQGLYVSDIRAASAGLNYASSGRKSKRMGTGRRLKNMAMFTRQLAVLVASGTPLVQALAALERQTKDVAWREMIESVRVKVEEGSTLAEA